MAGEDPDRQRIPLPPDFPVEWDDPADAARFWSRDRMHNPFPSPILAGQFGELTTLAGMNKAHEAYGRPIRMERRRINCFFYSTARTVVPPDQIAGVSRRAEENVGRALPTIWTRWQREWLPEVRRHLEWWEGFDLSGCNDHALAIHLRESMERSARCWEIHFQLAPLLGTPPSAFRDLYTDLFGEDRGLEAHNLLLVEDNKSLEADAALWRLSRTVADSPVLRELVASSEPAEVVRILCRGGDRDGPVARFRERLGAFLAEYGHRSGETGISGSTWIENPQPVIGMLRAYLDVDAADPVALHAARIEERDRSTDAARVALRGYPEPVREQFETTLARAREGSRLQEDHAFWIDEQSSARTRYVIIEAGRRLAAAGVIPSAADVLHLELDELYRALAGLPAGDLNDLVAARSAELARWSAVDAPTQIGARPPSSPPDTPASRAGARFFGAPVEQGSDPSLVNGTPASPGTVRGTARVIMRPADWGRLHAGEVLVAPTTSTAWTPLFRTAAAVVTDAGGVLSHCAIVAREYGIPAVVGTGVGTSRIRDGQAVEVDGDAGRVRILGSD